MILKARDLLILQRSQTANAFLGEAMQRLGQPAVIGQLIAGILLGPSLFGLIWPEMQRTLFPKDTGRGAEGHAERHCSIRRAFGVACYVTGMDTDVGLIRRIGRPAMTVSLTCIAIPLS
jgi:Kef-type K+ transport system membrane component KefB